MFFKCILGVIGCCIIMRTEAQILKALSVGDTVPLIPTLSVLNTNSDKINLSDHTDKLQIIDFWATWCSSCISKFPQLDSIQKEFGTRLLVLLVNWDEKQEKILRFLDKYALRKGHRLELPIIVGDTVLRTLFPHKMIPHYGWIYKGKVIATTGPEMLTATNFNSVLNGEKVSFKMKRDILDFNWEKSLSQQDNDSYGENLLYRSLFMQEIEGLSGGYKFFRDSISQRNLYLNFPMLKLYQLAYGFDLNRIMLDVKRPLQYAGTEPDLFSYELTAPIMNSAEKMKKFMANDLDRYLGLNGRMEKRKVACYVLRLAKDFVSLPDTVKPDIRENEDATIKYLKAVAFNVFVRDLNHSLIQWPTRPIFVDETGYKGKITIDMPVATKTDMRLLSKVLRNKGILMEKSIRNLDVFVLSDQ